MICGNLLWIYLQLLACGTRFETTVRPPVIIVADTRKRRRSPSPKRHSSPPHRLSSVRAGIMPPSVASPFLTWSPIFVPPWGPAFLPAALYPAALRSAFPGLVSAAVLIFVCSLLIRSAGAGRFEAAELVGVHTTSSNNVQVEKGLGISPVHF